MFTGIVQELASVAECHYQNDIMRYAITIAPQHLDSLALGASLSIDGACQTVAAIDKGLVWFDAIAETLQKTTLASLKRGQLVNIERAAKYGDEIGGHLLSGHVYGTAQLLKMSSIGDSAVAEFTCPPLWTKYLFPKGFIAIDGISLTLVDVSPAGRFTVHLIPETLRRTTLGRKAPGDAVNIEIDYQSQVIVDTVERIVMAIVK